MLSQRDLWEEKLGKRNRNLKQEPRTSATRTKDSRLKVSLSWLHSLLQEASHGWSIAPYSGPPKGEEGTSLPALVEDISAGRCTLNGQPWNNAKGQRAGYDDWPECKCVCVRVWCLLLEKGAWRIKTKCLCKCNLNFTILFLPIWVSRTNDILIWLYPTRGTKFDLNLYLI